MREVTVVTQNIDDLHQRAESSEVIHLHTSLAQPKCFACHRAPPCFILRQLVSQLHNGVM
ncbi:hypothetical protein E3Z29_01250 [Pseudomonas sp. S150]|nr:hypothetical protein E3Z29_01250 [Pseudomonas sp. S150]